MLKLQCGVVFWPLHRCFTPNHDSKTDNSQGKADYKIVSFFHCVWIFVEYLCILYKKGEGVWILWRGEERNWDVFRHFVWFWLLWTTEQRTQQHCGFCTCVKVSWFLICHRNVTKHTNPLQVHNLITNKSVAILEASTWILIIHRVKISVLAKVHQAAKEQDMLWCWTGSRVCQPLKNQRNITRKFDFYHFVVYNLYASAYIIRVNIQSRRMWWVGHVAYVEDMRN